MKRAHGTSSMYAAGCRCDPCREAKMLEQRQYRERRRAGAPPSGEFNPLLADLLHELAPFGLTDDCPVRKAMRLTGRVPYQAA